MDYEDRVTRALRVVLAHHHLALAGVRNLTPEEARIGEEIADFMEGQDASQVMWAVAEVYGDNPLRAIFDSRARAEEWLEAATLADIKSGVHGLALRVDPPTLTWRHDRLGFVRPTQGVMPHRLAWQPVDSQIVKVILNPPPGVRSW